jgi:Flp pilus assembly pilin Flp
MKRAFKYFLGDESGATSIEYGLIAAFIFLGIILVVTRIGTSLAGPFSKAAGNLG